MKQKTLLQLIYALGWNDLVNELKEIFKRLNSSIQNTKQIDVLKDVVLDDTYNNSIVKVKESCLITIPENLIEEFSCVFRTYTGVTARFINTNAVEMDAPRGLILEQHKMATLFKDGQKNTFILEGELTQ